MNYIKIYRLSINGFQSQKQQHIHDSYLNKEDFKKSIQHIENEYLRELAISGHIEMCPDFNTNGVFAFINKPTYNDITYFLNHIEKDKIKDTLDNLYTAYIPEDCICYHDTGFVYDSKNKKTIKESFNNKDLTIYIPEESLQRITEVSKSSLEKEFGFNSKGKIKKNKIFKLI